MVGSAASYEVTCRCGRAIRGERQTAHQIVSCPGCRRELFVLPRSPFDLAGPAEPQPRALRSWRAPLIAAAVCVGVLLAGFTALWPYLSRGGKGEQSGQGSGTVPDPAQELDAGRRALGQGKFHVARRILSEGLRRRELLTPEQSRDLTQLHRQADVLAALSPRSVEEIVRHAMLVRDQEEWEGQFADYRGRAVVFDDTLRRDADGHPSLAHHVLEVGDGRVRLALDDLEALRDLPLEDGPRVIFGARLRRCSREESGWVVRFDPGSGVLLTEIEAVEACFPTPLDDDAKETLRRQARWLDERAGAVPRP